MYSEKWLTATTAARNKRTSPKVPPLRSGRLTRYRGTEIRSKPYRVSAGVRRAPGPVYRGNTDDPEGLQSSCNKRAAYDRSLVRSGPGKPGAEELEPGEFFRSEGWG